MVPVEARPTELSVVVAYGRKPVTDWLNKKGMALVNPAQVDKLLTDLFQGFPDGFAMAKRIDQSDISWPVDASLVATLHACITEGRPLYRKAVLEWVMRSGVRFPLKPRDAVLFMEPGETVPTHGIVQNVLPETAEAIIAKVTSLDLRDRATPLVKITAEEVIERAPV
jgi:hypothetical protein